MTKPTRKSPVQQNRLNNRRPAKTRRNRRRRQSGSLGRWASAGLKGAGVVSALVAVNIGCLLAYNGLTSWEMFTARAVDVTGNQRLSKAAVRAQAGIGLGDNILAVNLTRSRRRLLAHPWVEEAEIAREIPERIRIRIKEHESVAVIDLGRRFIMDLGGVLFSEFPGEIAPDIPLVFGLDYTDLSIGSTPSSPAFQSVLEVLAQTSRKDAPLTNRQIETIRVDRDTGLTLSLRETRGSLPFREVFIGYGDYESKLAQLAALPSRLRRLGQPAACRWVDLADRHRTIVRPAAAESS
ncbi:MAG: FtsQ-type POTRA domain-containing protein [Desulfobacterales bacterium]